MFMEEEDHEIVHVFGGAGTVTGRSDEPEGDGGNIHVGNDGRPVSSLLTLGRAARDLEPACVAVYHRSIMNLDPMHLQLLDPTLFDARRVGSSGTRLRIALVGLIDTTSCARTASSSTATTSPSPA